MVSSASHSKWTALTLSGLDFFIPMALHRTDLPLFRARALVALVLSLTGIALVAFFLLVWIEQSIPTRRLITLALILCQPTVILLMHATQRISEACWLSVILGWILVWYIDFNNQSFSGPTFALWVIPTTVSALLLGRNAVLIMATLTSLSALIDYVLLKTGQLPPPIILPEKAEQAAFLSTLTTLILIALSLNNVMKLASARSHELTKEVALHKNTLQQLMRARDAAEKSARAKSDFLAHMSHELRTPLNAVLGNATLLQCQNLPDESRHRVDDINQAGELLLSLINDVLDLSKLESGKVPLHCCNFNLAELLVDLHRMLLPNVGPDVSFSVEGITEPYNVSGDPDRIAQMVLNLLSNAIKFTQRGQIQLSLRSVESRPSGQALTEISVRDTGRGISAEDQRKLFSDFVQVGSHQKHRQGSGLGLAITNRLAQLMDGCIELESAPEHGACFRLLLPLVRVDKAAARSTPIRFDDAYKQALGALEVLVVDDVPMNSFILRAMLEELGVRNISVASDGIEAIEAVKNKQFDLVFMDIQMPRMSGIEAASRIRMLGFQKAIIAVTANAFAEDRQMCLQNGMNEFIAKPIDFELLKQTIQSFV